MTGRRLSPETAEGIRLVQSGEVSTFLEAARRSGASRTAIQEACFRRGIESAESAKRAAAAKLRVRAVALVRAGSSMQAAARALGISRPVVSDACARAGVEGHRGAPRRIDYAALRAAWHLVVRGELTTGDLAARWSVSRSAVRQAALRLGLPPATWQGPRGPRAQPATAE